MFTKIKEFAQTHKDTLAKAAGASVVAGLVGATLLQNQRRANDRLEKDRTDFVKFVEDKINDK